MSRRFLLTALLGLFTVASFSLTGGGVPVMKTQASSCPDALNFKMKNIDGKSVDLCSYKGNVVLIVNVASKCGLTPQYEGLEALNQKYRSQGLRILGFPANDFLGQEPGTESEIKQFCTTKYKVSFDMFGKITVKGNEMNPLYKFLTAGGGDAKLAGEVKWNFQKYLIDRNGKLVAVFSPRTEPMAAEITSAIEAQLK
ncbi:MAG: glutathione peroxidase [Blastocatellia bacterium]|nr:glutathione peroxidase [Blastocatellia bacterium]